MTMRILVTGATGYVGGRLVPRLLAAGHEVVCLVRRPGSLDDRPWRDQVEVRIGDLLDPETLIDGLAGCDVAFYLVHSMGRHGDFRRAERESAHNFRNAGEAASLSRIVYLGGLGSGRLSEHLASRQEVGRLLAEGSVPVTELRAAVVIGSGSLSFEMLRSLTEVLPVMTTPRWVRTRCQPIAIEDLLTLLENAAQDPHSTSKVLDIGGPDVLSYEQMMRVYAREAGLRWRLIIPVPILSPGLSSLWVGLVTPLPAATARPLVSSLRNEVAVRDDRFLGLLGRPAIPFVEAVRRATTPAGVGSEDPAAPQPGDPYWSGGVVYREIRKVACRAQPETLAAEFKTIGGSQGYYAMNWAWKLRGLFDRVIGGPGFRRGRRHPDELKPGEALDFWRVESVVSDSLLLRAEMKLPGDAQLEFTAETDSDGSRLVQTATFRPRGLLGRLYWFVLYPVHRLVFWRMARAISSAAEVRQSGAVR
jgi:uncharacterized protein YbjT (DUF2867 family)